MQVSDYVAKFLVGLGIRHVFVVTGGANARLIDSVAAEANIEYVPTLHEQAAAMAVDGYTRVTGNMGAAIVTTGPGVTNLLTGMACLYYDSLPSIFLAGQVSTTRLSKNAPGVRQLGFQESPHVELVKPITKYAALVEDPSRIRYELEKAIHLATTGRPGPVFIDIPDDVQRMNIDPRSLPSFKPRKKKKVNPKPLEDKVERVLELIAEAERPILVLGGAIRIKKEEARARRLADRLGFPIALTWATMDMYETNHALNIGGFGISSTRRGNFAIQNSDLVLSIGSRLDSHATGTPASSFARGAKKVVVELDQSELSKFSRQGMKIDVKIQADVSDFFNVIDQKMNRIKTRDISPWLAKIADWRDKYPSCDPEFEKQKGSVNPYVFLRDLSKETAEGDIIFTDCGGNLIQTFQGYEIGKNQRVLSALNNSPMGYSLAGSMGGCFANDKRPVICIIGDGGLQVNIQELATINHHQLPIKIFLFNNHGYGIIQQTQDDWYDSRYHASRPEGGVPDPDYVGIARAFGIKALSIKSHAGMRKKIRQVLDHEGPVLCNLEFDPNQRLVPMLKSGRPIEDPNPLMPRDEFLKNMIVEPLEVSRHLD